MPTTKSPAKAKTAKATTASLPGVVVTGAGTKPVIVIHAPEKGGKSSGAANFPDPFFFLSHNEAGLETLIDHGQVPETAHMPPFEQWENPNFKPEDPEGPEKPGIIDALKIVLEHGIEQKTLVFDTINGFEDMCYKHVCDKEYFGDWGGERRTGFLAYGRGYGVATNYWRKMIDLLDKIRRRWDKTIVCLAHSLIKTQRNPNGSDYDCWKPDMNDNQWGVLHKLADVIMFIDRVIVVEEDGFRAKAQGGTQRIARCEGSATCVAGNRWGLTEFSCGNSAKEFMTNFTAEVKKARKK